MKIGILGAGMVGQNIATSLFAKGHDIMIGTRDVAKALATTEASPYGMPAFGVWHKEHQDIAAGNFADTARFGDIIFNATNGNASIDALKQAQAETLGDKILIDLGNKIGPSSGGPPASLANDETSLGEEIQSAFPDLRVVKTFNTMNTYVMMNPASVNGDTSVFVNGNDADAKAQVTALLKDFGWNDIIDLGDITASRAVEMMFPLWVKLWGVIGNTPFNFKIVR
jgi:8-hydroxy-5-deazaflavin:NADPH oxidoreductase